MFGMFEIMSCWRSDITTDYVARVIEYFSYHLYSGLKIKEHIHLDAQTMKQPSDFFDIYINVFLSLQIFYQNRINIYCIKQRKVIFDISIEEEIKTVYMTKFWCLSK